MQLLSPVPEEALRPDRLTALADAVGAFDEPIVSTKLFAPTLSRRNVGRPRLQAVLNRALEARLTLVVAPAGWGKSTMIAQWLQQQALPAGWLTLDSGDRDPTRFWRYLLLAIQQGGAPAAAVALRRLDAAGADVVRDVLPVLVNLLADSGRDLVVVLDDYHTVTGTAVHDSVASLLDHAPSLLHLIVSSRSDPALPLGRLRVAGDLVEVRAEQLRFTVGEAGELLERTCGDLDSGDVDRLVTRTEGWAAGLQLAALRLADRPVAARSEFIDRFTGADRHVVDYLGEEVLSGLSEDVREFLLQTSVLRRVCAPLADAVAARTDSASMLEAVERANLFLTPLDDEGRWYRYHQLFRDILAHELHRTKSHHVAVLHKRAAEWYAAHGDLEEAVEHALRSGDSTLATAVIAQGWRREFNLGHLETVQSWLRALPEPVLQSDPQLALAQVWLHMDAARLEQAGAALAVAHRLSPEDDQVTALRALHAFKSGNLAEASALLRTVPDAGAGVAVSPGIDAFVVTVHELLGGVCALWSGQFGDAARRMRSAARRAQDADNRLALIYAAGCAALTHILLGDLTETAALIAEADAAVAAGPNDAHFVALFPALATARLDAIQGRLPEARVCAERALDLARRGAGRIELAAALITAAQLRRETSGAGKGDGRHLLGEAVSLLHTCGDPGPVVRDWLEREQRASTRPDNVAEPLTDRERSILALLPTPLSQRELADSLFVTPNTMKTHLRAIYRKLGAQSRNDAVIRARSLGLL
jgi:LuxR family maltose regulon positive regulatory protein